MKKVTVNVSKRRNDRTSVPNIFLDYYMKDANGDFVKVYLYLLRCTNTDDPDSTISGIADQLNLTEKDILRALKYWAKIKVLDVTYDKDHEPDSITFLPLSVPEEEASEESVEKSEEPEIPAARKTRTRSAASSEVSEAPAKPAMSRARANALREQSDIADLLYAVQAYLGRPMNRTESDAVLRFYDSLGFGVELIEYLVQTCIENNHTSFRYMETVANSWADRGVRTVEDAKAISQNYNKRVNLVMKTFGFSDRKAAPNELEFIDRWFSEYAFDPQIVENACQKTLLRLSKPSFPYADKILRGWYEAHVHTLEDVQKLENQFHASKAVAPADDSAVTSSGETKTTRSTNRFNSFSHRTYNYDELEKGLLATKRES